MATVYSGQYWTGSYTYTRVRVDYSGSSATAILLYSRTNSYSGETSAYGATFSFGGASVAVNAAFYGQKTDAEVARVSFSISPAGGTYSGSCNGSYLAFSGSVTIPAQTSTITYNANGGSGAPSAQTYTNATSGTTTLSSTKPTRTGYNFLGWSLSSTATSASYSAGQSWNLNNYGNYTLYAVWQIITYTVSYNANGGTGAPGSQSKNYGATLTLSSTKPTRSNTTANGYTVTFNSNGGNSPSKASATATNTTSYSFKNWNTNSGGSGTSYNAGASYTANASATLYAQWNSSTSKGAITTATVTRNSSTSTRTVTLNATTNGGSCSTSSLSSSSTTTYSCNGWYTATSGGTKRCDSGGSYTPSATETVYAQWGSSTTAYNEITLPNATKSTVTNKRTVTFNTQGGICLTNSLESTSTVTYTFTGWYTASSGGTLRGGNGGKYTPTASETLYAQFSSSGGDYSAITLPAVARDGYKFKGWSTNQYDSSGMMSGTYTPSASETLYAIWEEVGTSGSSPDIYIKINGKWQKVIQTLTKANGEWIG